MAPPPWKLAQNEAVAASARSQLPPGVTALDEVRVLVVCECDDTACHHIVATTLAALSVGPDRPPCVSESCSSPNGQL